MTYASLTYELSPSALQKVATSSRFVWFWNAIQRMQHARMMQAMNLLSDDVLLEIGVERSEIREYSKRLVSQSQ